MPLLEVRDVHLYYATGGRPVRAVDGVSFAIERRGEAIAVVGESGSGKTSLANVLIGGRELTALPEEEYRREIRWRRIAMVFQGAMNVLNPVLKVGDQVAEPLLLDGRMDKKSARAKVEDLL